MNHYVTKIDIPPLVKHQNMLTLPATKFKNRYLKNHFSNLKKKIMKGSLSLFKKKKVLEVPAAFE